MRHLLTANIFCLVLFYCEIASAGGPLVLEGPNGNTPVNYLNANITLDVESGSLGSLSNANANALVQQALNLWNNVTTSTINLNLNNASLNIDVNATNYATYIPINGSAASSPDDNLNPLIYDNNGSIIDAFFGSQSNNIIGFAASSTFNGASNFSEGFVVINGSNFGFSNADYVLLFAHEIGHYFGLDHSQVNINNQESATGFPSSCSTSILNNYPVMYPISCRDTGSLHADDISAVSALYPEPNINDNLGILEGRLTTDIGSALLGANIWVENTITGEIYSIVSDYLRERTGFYRLYLPAASYTLHANSINAEFINGSGVGPYSNGLGDASFTAPHPITPFTYQDITGTDIIIPISVNQTTTVNFNSIDVSPPPVPASTKGKGGSSHLTLLFMLTILVCVRRIKRQH